MANYSTNDSSPGLKGDPRWRSLLDPPKTNIVKTRGKRPGVSNTGSKVRNLKTGRVNAAYLSIIREDSLRRRRMSDWIAEMANTSHRWRSSGTSARTDGLLRSRLLLTRKRSLNRMKLLKEQVILSVPHAVLPTVRLLTVGAPNLCRAGEVGRN